jgi:hypothetical protein
MPDIHYDSPQNAPATMMSADGKNVLRRYRVDAVVYARSYQEAVGRVNQANIYLDAARVLTEQTGASEAFQRFQEG